MYTAIISTVCASIGFVIGCLMNQNSRNALISENLKLKAEKDNLNRH